MFRTAVKGLALGLAVMVFLTLLASVVFAEGAAELILASLQALAAAAIGYLIARRFTPRTEPPVDRGPGHQVTRQLRALDERLAGQRPEVELTSNRLQKVMGRLGDRFLLVTDQLVVTSASPDVGVWLGVGDYDFAGRRLSDLLGPDHPLVALAAEAASRRRDVDDRPILLRAPQPRQISTSAQFINDEGRQRVLLSIRDAESMRRLEAHVDYATKLAQLGRITSGVSHEIKNPLNSMAIHVEVLRSKLEAGNTDVAPQLDVLDTEIKRLDRVVRTFLDFARPVEAHLDPIDLNRIVEGVVRLAQAEAQARGVRIVLQLAPEPLAVKADADLLTQAILNIVINGCQAMPSGGLLRVATLRGPDRAPRVEVEDAGIGIPPEAREKVFNLYYTTKEGGSGIGLAQTFRAVQIHNGRIDVRSEPGQGTTFTISLPEA